MLLMAKSTNSLWRSYERQFHGLLLDKRPYLSILSKRNQPITPILNYIQKQKFYINYALKLKIELSEAECFLTFLEGIPDKYNVQLGKVEITFDDLKEGQKLDSMFAKIQKWGISTQNVEAKYYEFELILPRAEKSFKYAGLEKQYPECTTYNTKKKLHFNMYDPDHLELLSGLDVKTKKLVLENVSSLTESEEIIFSQTLSDWVNKLRLCFQINEEQSFAYQFNCTFDSLNQKLRSLQSIEYKFVDFAKISKENFHF
jgi:hypothetical protein